MKQDMQIHDFASRVFYLINEEHFFSMRGFIETYAKNPKAEITSSQNIYWSMDCWILNGHFL